MNKHTLYENIMKNVSRDLKHMLNEDTTAVNLSDDEIMSMVEPKYIYTDEKGEKFLDFDWIDEMPTEIIDQLVKEILLNSTPEFINNPGEELFVNYYIENAPTLLLKSADAFGVTLECKVYIECDLNYHKGLGSTDRDVEPDYDETTVDGCTVTISDVKLSDGGNSECDILNEELIDMITENLTNSDIVDEYCQEQAENYEPEDYNDEYDPDDY